MLAHGEDSAQAHQRAVAVLEQLLIRLEIGDPESDRYIFQEGWRDPRSHFVVAAADAPRFAELSAFDGDRRRVVEARERRGTWPVRRWDASTSSFPNLTDPVGYWGGGQVVERLFTELPFAFSDDETEPAVNGMFWRALVAAGRQGIFYLYDSLEGGTV